MPADIWPSLLFPAILFTGLAVYLWRGVFFRRRSTSQSHVNTIGRGTVHQHRLIIGTFGLIFFTVPTAIGFVSNRTFDPPLTSAFWPRSNAVVTASRFEEYPVGNGTIAARVYVTVDNSVELSKVTYAGISVAEAKRLVLERYSPNIRLKVMKSPTAKVYEVRWRFSDLFAVIFLLVGSVCYTVSLFAFRLAFT